MRTWARRFLDDIIFILVLALFGFTFASGVAYAAGPTATLTWTNPTTFVDGTPLPAAQLKEIRIVVTHVQGRLPERTVVVPPTPSTTQISGLLCGDFSFVAFAVSTAASNNVSDPTSPVTYPVGVQCSNKPNPPTAVGAN